MYVGELLNVTETLYIEQCYKCRCYFAMPQSLRTSAKLNGVEFFCPHGHGQVYIESETTKLKNKIEQMERNALLTAQVINNKNQRIEQLSYSVRAQKAAKTKIMNRVKNGVCPCCNRTFKDLQNHFKTKHPELI